MNEPPTTSQDDSGLTSLSMLDRVQAKDAEAWKRLVHLYSPLVYYWCQRNGLSNEDSADLMQDVWGAVAANVARFHRTRESGTFRGWLWTITRNKLRDYYRTRAGKAVAVGGSSASERMANVPEIEPPSESESDSGSLIHRALQMIRGDFEPNTWTAFWRTSVEGATAGDVGKDLKMSVDAVYQAKSRVLRRLRDELRGIVD